jgi:high affinity Mn2+ porin
MGRLVLCLFVCAGALVAAPAWPQEPGPAGAPAPPDTLLPHLASDRFWLSAQANVIFQAHPSFPARYSGPNSLRATTERATSTLLTLFTGMRVTGATEVVFDVERAGGHGISDALGLAGFTDLDVVRNPGLGTAPYVARAMVHHTFALGADHVAAERTTLSFAREVPARRLDLWVGKFGTVDFFDLNSVGSNSYLQFTNWTVDNNGAYDYAADTRGYTWGVVVEYHDRGFAARFGELLMPKVANGIDLDWNIGRARAENVEVEWRRPVLGRPTTVRLLAYANHGNMGDYREAVRRFDAGQDPEPTIENTRQQGTVKYGFGANAEQQISPSVRAFTRWGWNEPHHESFAYTEVNDTVAAGADVAGGMWHRPQDKVGVALVTNGISADHQEYLRLGGLGFLLGDGSLRCGRETIVEAYYTARLWRGVFASADLQGVVNPGYNADRGPVAVFSLRLHIDF